MDTSTSVVNVSVKNLRPTYHSIHHWLQNPNHVYIGRRIHYVGVGDSPWGNPFSVTKHGRLDCIAMYKKHIRENMMDQVCTLRGKTLGCWCKPEPCHGDALVQLINEDILAGYGEKHAVLSNLVAGREVALEAFDRILADETFPLSLYEVISTLLKEHNRDLVLPLAERLIEMDSGSSLLLAEHLLAD